jgi:ribosomal protein S18 acetylase RimI-like enzyme
MNNNEQIKKLTKKDYEQFKNVLYVFKEAPWYENLTEEDVKSEWQLYEKSKIEKALEKDIIMPNDFYSVLGYFVDDQLVSMISYTLSYGNDDLHLEHGVDFNKDDIISYIYGMATLSSARGHGYNTKLLKQLVEYFKQININKSYARYAVNKDEINYVNQNYDIISQGHSKYPSKSESINILKKCGYIEYFKNPYDLHIQNLSDAEYKFNHEEDLRAFVVLDCDKEKVKKIKA